MTDQETFEHPTGNVPRSVDLVCLGETARTDYFEAVLSKGTGFHLADETWTLNRGISLFAHHVGFVLDDMDSEAKIDPAYGDRLRGYLQNGGEIITTTVPGTYPHAGQITPYPARLVLDSFGMDATQDPYWHNSVPMILAYAHAIGVRELNVWGADYTMPDGRTLEDQRANAEYWIGRCRQAGMVVRVCHSSTLCNARSMAKGLRVYGLVSQDSATHKAFLMQGPAKMAGTQTIGELLDKQRATPGSYARLKEDFKGVSYYSSSGLSMIEKRAQALVNGHYFEHGGELKELCPWCGQLFRDVWYLDCNANDGVQAEAVTDP